MNVLVNKNAPLLRGGGDKLKNFVVVSVVSVVVVVVVAVVVCCGDIDIDIDIIIDRTLLLYEYSYTVISSSSLSSLLRLVLLFLWERFFSSKFKDRGENNVKKKHACLASIIQNGIH